MNATDIPLLESYEITQNPVDITNNFVHNNHNELLNNDLTTDSKTQELIEILGGMDHILEYYLSNNNKLNEKQLTHINDIISSLKDTKLTQNTDKSIIYLYKTDNLLHSMFREPIANQIVNILFSKAMGTLIGILVICFIITYVSGQETNPIYQYPLDIIASSLLLILLLSVNKFLFRKTLLTFDFIIKTFYVLRLFICKVVLGKYNIPEFIGDINYILVVITITLVDGMQLKRKVKIASVCLVAVLYSCYALQYTFYHKPMVMKVFDEWKIDMTALIASSYRVIALFAWAQTYRVFTGGNTSTMITKPVSIRWINT